MNDKPTQNKSIIDRVLEKKQREQEEQKRKIEEEHKRKQQMRSLVNAFISTFSKKVEQNKPVFTPRGRWIGNVQWSKQSDDDYFNVIAKEKLSLKLLTMNVTYVQHLDEEKTNLILSEGTREIDNSLANPSKFTCFIVNDCENEKIIHLFSTFEHYGYFPFLYSLKQKHLWYNTKEDFIDYFARWFHPQKTPVQLNDIIKDLANDHDIITISSVQKKFIFDEDEAKKMLESLEGKNIVYHLKGSEYAVNK